ncbi:hypothetical protein J7E88_08885 [Streptomyces sp. ISL-10]|uniref:hypothetical protein n=1 Tax=Streptomyces sp. ISL-10 TaxID=2819172 RepID=UPI001BEB44CD|nr:hypothetical protein [Streptomyces sp. ISL-10]MBT2365430.1 hypothetical protein [Streptomyces sp. ISL-10]
MTTTPTTPLLEGPAMSRVAGLPTDFVTTFAAPEVAEALERIAGARRALEALAPTMSDLLHAAVPHMSSAAARRKVLDWRRRAHAGEPTEVAADLLAEVRSRLDPAHTAVLDRWTHWSAALSALRSQLGDTAADADIREERTLRQLVAEPALANALAIVSPVFSHRTRRPSTKQLSRGARLTAYRYAVRAALKTSPLSSFTELAYDRAAAQAQPRVSLHPLITRVLLREAASRPGIREELKWRVNRSLRTGPGWAWLSEPQLHAGDGFGWSNEETVDARRRPDLTQAVRVPGELSRRRLARHLESGLIDIDDPCPQDELLDWLTTRLVSAPEPCARKAGDHLATAAAELATMARGDVQQRAGALAEVKGNLRSALHALGAAGWPLTEVTTLYEDRAASVSAAPLDPRQRDALRRHARAACDSLQVSAPYRAMTEEFVSRFGPGGVCSDVFGFCRDLARTGWPHTLDGPPADRPARPGRSSCQPCVAVLCQGAGEDPAGEPLVVVNHLSTGTGGLLARFHRLFSGADGLADHIRAWLRTLYPDAELLEFVPARIANPLQADSSGLLPALHWPTAPRQFGPGVDIEELELFHDPTRHALELRRRSGSVVGPVYLGTVPQHLIGGPERALLVIADPWSAPPEFADAAVPLQQSTAKQGDHLPRRSIAGVVVRRESRTVAAAEVPRRTSGESLVDFLERMDRWRRAHGLPAEVYVRAETGVPMREDRIRKPVWLAFASPTGMQALTHLAEKAGTRRLVFTECLPGRAGHGVDGGVQPRAAEHVLHFCSPGFEHGGA